METLTATLSRQELDALGERIATISSEIDAATHELLTELRQFDNAGGWHTQGALSCAHWLSWRTGLSLGPAREKVRVAGCLADLPLIDKALRSGQISYSKVRALTRVATPETEQHLLDIAAHSTAAQLEKICRLYRAHAGPPRQAPEDAADLRWVRSRPTDDGMVRIQLQLPADEAAMVLEAMHVSAETSDQADGVVAMAEAALRGSSERVAKPPVEVMVHVDAATLTGHTSIGDGISAETSRRLLCDCGVVPTLEDQSGRLIDAGRKRRTVAPSLRRALVARDRGCRFPGCTNTRCDAHHIEHWIDDGETTADNLVLLCRRHHRYVHEFGFRLDAAPDGDVRFYDPYERLIPATGRLPSPRIGALDRMRARHHMNGVEIDAVAAYPGWNGKRVNYDRIVSPMLRRGIPENVAQSGHAAVRSHGFAPPATPRLDTAGLSV